MNRFAPYLRADAPDFALLYRPGAHASKLVELVSGPVVKAAVIADLPLRSTEGNADEGHADGDGDGGARHDVLALVPFKQIAERGFAAADDDAELLAMVVEHQESIPLAEALDALPAPTIEIDEFGFDIDDADYAACVRQVMAQDIGGGAGSNFVVPRTYLASIRDYTLAKAAALFRALLSQEVGAYWTFLAHIGGHTYVGASPEPHVSVNDGIAAMNPISGTYVFPPSGPESESLVAFLADRKETEELVMVLEEELKTMSAVCDSGGRAFGPFLKEMGHLAHTEYVIEGPTSLDLREVLRRTLFSPAVTGSPLESACRVIRRREPQGRGYYGGVLALFGADANDRPTLDSAILIRTARIDSTGVLTLTVGATVVRHSDPDAEAAETRGKAAGLLASLGSRSARVSSRPPARRLAAEPAVREALARRNDALAPFWLATADGTATPSGFDDALPRRSVLVIDAEDSFTGMLAHQIRSLGAEVTVRRFDELAMPDDFDLVVLGPGPGDPRQHTTKMRLLAAEVDLLLAARKPFIAVCLSHQILCGRLGITVRPLWRPNQGTQREITVFGERARVGFYNSFAGFCDFDEIHPHGFDVPVTVNRDAATGEIHLLRGPGFVSWQFHPESVLSPDGVRVIDTALSVLLPDPRPSI